MLRVPSTELIKLEEQVSRALSEGDESGLDILGYGEVTLVLRLRTSIGDYACKRLPTLEVKQLDAYRAILDEYMTRLSAAGVHVPPINMWTTTLPSGVVEPYILQETLPTDRLGSTWLKKAREEDADRFFGRVLEHTLATVTPDCGLDVQASNWIVHDDRLDYLDITTPFLRDEKGKERLDFRPFFRSLPWGLRELVRVGMGSQIFDKFYTPRSAIIDLLGNLHKERLAHFIPRFLEAANKVLEPAITAEEVEKYYEEDAKMWVLIQKLRRADRWWQRTVRRRTYPFLLPPQIAR